MPAKFLFLLNLIAFVESFNSTQIDKLSTIEAI